MGNDQSALKMGDLIYRQMHGEIGHTTNELRSKIGYHYGIYLDDDTVVHFTKGEGVDMSSLKEFSLRCGVKKESVANRLPREFTVLIALYFAKNPDEWDDYSLLFNNCEHFARFCVTGKKQSDQVDIGLEIGWMGVKLGIEFLNNMLGNE